MFCVVPHGPELLTRALTLSLCLTGVEEISLSELELKDKWEQSLGPQYDVLVRF